MFIYHVMWLTVRKMIQLRSGPLSRPKGLYFLLSLSPDDTAQRQTDYFIHLLIDGDVGRVYDDGIPGLDQRTFLALAVDLIPFLKICNDGVQIHQVLFFKKFALPAESPD